MRTAAGLTFGPPTQGQDPAQKRASGALTPGSKAVDVLSMTLPKVLGRGAITPRSLLTPDPSADTPGGSGWSPESAVLQSVMRTLPQFSRGMGMGTAPVAPIPAAPSPSSMGFPAVSGAGTGQGIGAPSMDLMTMLRAALQGGGPRIQG